MAGNSDPLTPRAKIAVTAGKAVAAASRAAGRGSGSVIGGRVALKLDPDLLARLAQNLDVVLVSATNGKTTTTRLIAEALRAAGPVGSLTLTIPESRFAKAKVKDYVALLAEEARLLSS